MVRTRRPGLLSPSRFLRQGALYKGLLGGSRGWMVVGAVMWGGRFLRKSFGRVPELVATEKLTPGQFVSIEAIPMATKHQRREAKRTAPRLVVRTK